MGAHRHFVSAVHRRLITLAWFSFVLSFTLATPVPSCPADCQCSSDGGGLRKAICTSIRWNEIAYPEIRALVLRPSNKDAECDKPENLSLLFPQLNSISMPNCSLTNLPANSFHGLRSLKEVDLAHNHLSYFSPTLFADNLKLWYVNLANNPVSWHPLPWSDTILEVNLAHCNLSGRLPASIFVGLPNLRYLSLADNRLETIAENSLPSGLKRLNLSGNSITDVPLSELHRLQALKEIDISRNPVHCTCQLMGFQNWLSRQGTIFRNQIWCTSPSQYAGYSLVNVPRHSLCDVDDLHNQLQPQDNYPLGERFSKVDADKDEFLFNVEISRVLGEERGHRRNRRSDNQLEKISKTENNVLEGSGDEGADVEGSGTGPTNADEIITSTSSKPNNESTFPSTIPTSPTEFNSSSESNSSSVSSSPSTDNSNSQPTTVSSDAVSELKNTSNVIPDAGTITPEKEPNSTDPIDAKDVKEGTTIPPTTIPPTTIPSTTIPNDSISNQSTSEEVKVGTNDSAPISSSEATSSKRVEDTTAEITSPESSDPAQVSHSTDEPENLNSTERGAVETVIETGSTTPGQTTTQEPPEKETHPATTPDKDMAFNDPVMKETTVVGVSEKKDDNGTSSTVPPIQGQMTNNETVKTATSAPYIIPTLLVVAVALICLAIYFSQYNCRPKSWNRNHAKANGPATELQDVSLLRHRNPDLYSKKYEAEGQNPQTEKLTNGDGGGGGGGGGGGDYPTEENGALLANQSLAGEIVPAVRKSTTRVTTNYESLPKTPIIIQKS